MGRPPKPWFWKQKQVWCVTLDGKRIRLARDKDEAFDKFYKLMADRPEPFTSDSLVVVMDELVEWNRKNRSEGTFRYYLEHTQQFTDWLKSEKRLNISCADLTPDVFEAYLEECAPGRQSGAVQVVKRVFNWANKRGRIKVNPILALEKPPSSRRKNYIAESVYKEMVNHSDQNFTDLLTFAWETGCRPQEAWKLDSSHIQEEYQRLCIPLPDTKRKKSDRHIYCTDAAWAIVLRLNGKGEFLFQTTTGTQWQKSNVGNRMARLKKHLGKRYAFYDLRHTWITNRVKEGMDIHLIAKLAGTSIAMIEKHYDQSDEDAKFMLSAVQSGQTGQSATF